MTCSILRAARDNCDPAFIALPKLPGVPGATAVPEESVFGIASRYHVLTGHQAAGATLIELLGKRNVSLNTAFPSGLQVMCRRLALPGDSIQDLIEHHTILPYFRPFTQTLHYRQITQKVADGFAGNAKISLGLLASRVGAQDILRYCPACVEADLETIGVATWYRVHQLPGVLICPYHGELLNESFCLAQRLMRQQLFLPALGGQGFARCCIGAAGVAAIRSLQLVAGLSAQILSLDDRPFNAIGLRNEYAARLVDRALASSPSRMRRAELSREFAAFWSSLKDISPFSSLLAGCDQDESWLVGLCRKPRCTHHPLKHILLIGFLAKDAASFFGTSMRRLPILAGTLRMKKTELSDCKIVELLEHGTSVRQVASVLNWSTNTLLVKAEKAGALIKRRPKKIDAGLRVQVRRMLATGESITGIMHAANLSAASVHRLLGGDRATHQERVVQLRRRRQQQARESVNAVLLENPAAGFNAVRASVSADFSWLYRNDHEWLEDRLQPHARARPNKKNLIDWLERDLRTSRQVEEAAAEILHAPGKPIRVTRNEIGRRTAQPSWLDKHLTKLPSTKAVLHAVIESPEAFRDRRLRWWSRELATRSPYEPVADWKIARAAGVRHLQDGERCL